MKSMISDNLKNNLNMHFTPDSCNKDYFESIKKLMNETDDIIEDFTRPNLAKMKQNINIANPCNITKPCDKDEFFMMIKYNIFLVELNMW